MSLPNHGESCECARCAYAAGHEEGLSASAAEVERLQSLLDATNAQWAETTQECEGQRVRADAAEAEVARLRKLFDDAGQGEHNVLALIDHYQLETFTAESEVERLKARVAEIEKHAGEARMALRFGIKGLSEEGAIEIALSHLDRIAYPEEYRAIDVKNAADDADALSKSTARIAELEQTIAEFSDMIDGEHALNERLIREGQAKADRAVALREMANARRAAQDAQGDADVARWIAEEKSDEVGGVFAKLYQKTKEQARELAALKAQLAELSTDEWRALSPGVALVPVEPKGVLP